MSRTSNTLDIPRFLVRPASRRFAIKVLILCGALSAVEGIDIYIVASVLPVLAKIYGVQPAAFAAVFVAQAIGQTLGSCFGAPLADRVGRRPVILLSVVAFGALTFAAAFATSVAVLAPCARLRCYSWVLPNLTCLRLPASLQRLPTDIVSCWRLAVSTHSGAARRP